MYMYIHFFRRGPYIFSHYGALDLPIPITINRAGLSFMRSDFLLALAGITAHSHGLCREIGAFGGTGELHFSLLDVWDRGLVVPAAYPSALGTV